MATRTLHDVAMEHVMYCITANRFNDQSTLAESLASTAIEFARKYSNDIAEQIIAEKESRDNPQVNHEAYLFNDSHSKLLREQEGIDLFNQSVSWRDRKPLL